MENITEVKDQVSSDEEELKRIKLLHYENLRKYFTIMIEVLLGDDYYNNGMDHYQVDINTMTDLIYTYGNRKQREKWSTIIKYVDRF